MGSLKCKICDDIVEKSGEVYICASCGRIAESFVKECTDLEIKDDEKNEKKHLKKIIATVVCIICVVCFLGMIGSVGKITDRKMKKILKENGYSYLNIDTVKVEEVIELNYVKELKGNNKLVLISNKTDEGKIRYGLGAVNLADETITDLPFGYAPLNIVINLIFDSGKSINIYNMKMVKEYIEKFGFYCFENQENAEQYLRQISGKYGIISADIARREIINSIQYILPDINEAKDFEVIFEEDNANPMYYTALSSTMVYNWGNFIPESHYEIYEANLDRSTLATMQAMYGPPYVQKTVWAVVDKNFKQVGTFDSKQAMEENLKNKKSVSKKVEKK